MQRIYKWAAERANNIALIRTNYEIGYNFGRQQVFKNSNGLVKKVGNLLKIFQLRRLEGLEKAKKAAKCKHGK